ncbi:uncharacterized protein BDZ99DRAFT_552095 [Mytilinidion resinicola]|uniref:Zn(2)-C6 fungal-type domain-containing protein n=1 Tax=Mytilinidion resinicola TaxID=574789 RepID=A0A6A6Y095_9PEZI|nr:uncharacterized protein BDZ99DRAFT_552095 [Mytilinidion resinicola]KAF2802192.1 hypothetical protein BDZ99DRAFT_552095 [Mytilinidion resinicola]
MSASRSSSVDAGQASFVPNQRAVRINDALLQGIDIYFLQCDNCRTRKIKCDKLIPCSSCRASKTTCRTTQEKKDPRQRVLISGQYEKKIDRIEDRLASIERMLRALTTNMAATQHSSPDSGISVAPSAHGYEEAHPPLDDDVPFEGDTSLNAHSVFASRLLEQKVGSDGFTGQNPEMAAALSSLRNIVSKGFTETEECQSGDAPRSNAGKLRQTSVERPPRRLVLEFLERAEANLNGLGYCFFPFLTGKRLRDSCSAVYDNEHCSSTTQILFYGGMQTACVDYLMVMHDDAAEQQYGPLAALCRRNFEALLLNLPLLMPATIENVQALLLGGCHYMELSKPSSCWTLTAHAASLSQSLGCHRISSMNGDPEDVKEMKMFLFWSIYTIDKSLSLRLGRSSTIRDDDISIPQPVPGGSSPAMWKEMVCHWIKFTKVQGQVYDQLYSPAAFAASHKERIERARMLVFRIGEVNKSNQSKLTKDPIPEDARNIFSHADQVTMYSTLTLIYRAIPPRYNDLSNTFSTECIESARAAIRQHLECADQYKNKHPEYWAGYIGWAVMNAPFTPFLVLFCHVITVYEQSDLSLLCDFVATLYSHKKTSVSTEKLRRLFDVFYRVAKVYVESKTQDLYGSQPAGNAIPPSNDFMDVGYGAEFDAYLSQLGMAPNPVYPNTAQENEFDASTNLQEWFSGNQYIMGLLEQDLTNIDMP